MCKALNIAGVIYLAGFFCNLLAMAAVAGEHYLESPRGTKPMFTLREWITWPGRWPWTCARLLKRILLGGR